MQVHKLKNKQEYVTCGMIILKYSSFVLICLGTLARTLPIDLYCAAVSLSKKKHCFMSKFFQFYQKILKTKTKQKYIQALTIASKILDRIMGYTKLVST